MCLALKTTSSSFNDYDLLYEKLTFAVTPQPEPQADVSTAKESANSLTLVAVELDISPSYPSNDFNYAFNILD